MIPSRTVEAGAKLELTLATFEAELLDRVFDVLKMFVRALNRLEEVGCIVSTADGPAAIPSTSSWVLVSILANCPPVIPKLNSGCDVWVERAAFACLFAPMVAPPEIFEVPASLMYFQWYQERMKTAEAH